MCVKDQHVSFASGKSGSGKAGWTRDHTELPSCFLLFGPELLAFRSLPTARTSHAEVTRLLTADKQSVSERWRIDAYQSFQFWGRNILFSPSLWGRRSWIPRCLPGPMDPREWDGILCTSGKGRNEVKNKTKQNPKKPLLPQNKIFSIPCKSEWKR